jgi:hypothetical protein
LAIACGWVWYKDHKDLVQECSKLYKSIELGNLDKKAYEFVKKYGKYGKYWSLARVTGTQDLNTPEGRQNFIRAVAGGIDTERGKS